PAGPAHRGARRPVPGPVVGERPAGHTGRRGRPGDDDGRRAAGGEVVVVAGEGAGRGVGPGIDRCRPVGRVVAHRRAAEGRAADAEDRAGGAVRLAVVDGRADRPDGGRRRGLVDVQGGGPGGGVVVARPGRRDRQRVVAGGQDGARGNVVAEGAGRGPPVHP